jgi:hypothetical protein
MRRYTAGKITRDGHKACNKYGILYQSQGNQYALKDQYYDTLKEAQEYALIERLKDHQYEMDKIQNELIETHGLNENNIGNILA